MRVELLFFAQLKDALGRPREILEVADGQTVDDVVASLRSRDEWRAITLLPLVFAVNEQVVDGGCTLCDGDRLAFLTPVSGG